MQPLLQWEKRYVVHIVCVRACVCVCVCNLSNLARKAHASYYIAMVFSRYLINGTIFEEKKLIEHKMCALIFSTTSVRKISYCNKKRARYHQKCILVFMYGTRYCFNDFKET